MWTETECMLIRSNRAVSRTTAASQTLGVQTSTDRNQNHGLIRGKSPTGACITSESPDAHRALCTPTFKLQSLNQVGSDQTDRHHDVCLWAELQFKTWPDNLVTFQDSREFLWLIRWLRKDRKVFYIFNILLRRTEPPESVQRLEECSNYSI